MPHFTAYYNDFGGQPLQLQKFHITYNYQGKKHKPVHVYYKIQNGQAIRTGVDAKRAGDVDEQSARDSYFNDKAKYDGLAQAFINNVFP